MIAVTGGAGFLGSHLCERLIRAGHTVICLDNLKTGHAENVGHLLGSGRFLLIEHDIIEPIDRTLPRFDDIYNLACPASPVHYQMDPVRTALTCVHGALNCLERAATDGARMFHASTSEIYGDPETHPQSEGYFGNVNTVGPRSCYDEGKRFAETLITDFDRNSRAKTKIARIFNTYGPRMRQDDGRVVSNFIVQALKGEDITVFGAGDQTRSFCFVDDTIEGVLKLMESGDEVVGPVNIGNPVEMTVGELALMVIALTASRSKVIYQTLPIDDPKRRRPDISKALALLGWSPVTPLREGLRRTIEYFREQIGAEPAHAEDRRVAS